MHSEWFYSAGSETQLRGGRWALQSGSALPSDNCILLLLEPGQHPTIPQPVPDMPRASVWNTASISHFISLGLVKHPMFLTITIFFQSLCALGPVRSHFGLKNPQSKQVQEEKPTAWPSPIFAASHSWLSSPSHLCWGLLIFRTFQTVFSTGLGLTTLIEQ